MIQTKLFKTIRQEQTVYPEIIDEALQNAINDWFDYRHVVDDQMFEVYFRRTLNKDYHHYLELLRIEPGYAHYDWLVQQYRERKLDRSNTLSNDGTRDIRQNNTGNNTITTTGTITDAGSNVGSGTTTNNLREVIADNTDITKTNTGTVTNTDTKSLTDSTNKSESENYTADDVIRDNSTTIKLRTDDLRASRIFNTANGSTTNSSYSGDSERRDRNTNNVSNISKAAPMSVAEELSYSVDDNNDTKTRTSRIGGIIEKGLDEDNPQKWGVNNSKAMPRIKWENASAIGQTGSDGTVLSKSNNSGTNNSGTTGEESGTVVDTNTGTQNNNITDNRSITTEKDDTKVITGTTSTTHTGTDTNQRVDDTTEISDIDESRTKDNTGTISTADRRDTDNTRTLNTTITRGLGTTVTTTQSDNGTREENGEEKEIYTGRAVDIATLLSGAKSFIISTDAFEWLVKRISPCFMGVYDL